MNITIGNRTFVSAKDFHGEGDGYYKNFTKGIYFYYADGELFLFLSRDDGGFFVSCFQEGDYIWHCYSTSNTADTYLGFDKIKYSERNNLAAQILKQIK